MKIWRNVDKIVLSPEKRKEILSELRQVSKKWSTIKYLNYWTIPLYQSLWQENGSK